MRLRWSVLLLGLVGLPVTGHSQPRPVVSIQARTAIVVDPIRRRPGGIEITGRVQERITDIPVPNAEVAIRVDGDLVRLRTDSEGRFRAQFPLDEGGHTLRVEFDGQEHYSAAAHQIDQFDVGKEPLTLTLTVEEEYPSTVKNIPVVVRANAEHRPVSIRAELLGGDASRESLDRIGVIVTNANGRGEASFDRAKLGGAGRKRIEVRFPGNETLDPQEAYDHVLIKSGTTLTLDLGDDEVRFEGAIAASGYLRDDFGEGVAGEPVSLVNGSKSLADAVTNSDGRFSFKVGASELGAGRFNLQAVFDSRRDWLTSSRSENRPVTIEEQRPVPVGYTLAAFGATAAALLAFVALRTRPWEAWLARFSRDRDDADGKSKRASSGGDDKPVHTGLALARPSLVSTLRRASDFSFSGIVRDAVSGETVHAIIRLSHPEHGDATVETDAFGTFEFERILPGEWNAKVSSPGYVTERFGVSIPHRGELRDARIDMLPVREKIFAMYKDAAAPLLPDAELWGIWTPRQIFDHVRKARPARALSALTNYVEEAYFSQRVPDESALPVAAQHVAAARAEAAS